MWSSSLLCKWYTHRRAIFWRTVLHTSLRARCVAVSVLLTCVVPDLVSHSRDVCLTLSHLQLSLSMKSNRVVTWNSGDPNVILTRLGSSIHLVELPHRVLGATNRPHCNSLPLPLLAHITSFLSCIAGPTWNTVHFSDGLIHVCRFGGKHPASQVVSSTTGVAINYRRLYGAVDRTAQRYSPEEVLVREHLVLLMELLRATTRMSINFYC